MTTPSTLERLRPLAARAAVAALAVCSSAAQSNEFTIHGTLNSTTDVARIYFDIDHTVAMVDFWTTSAWKGANFDPVIQVWLLDSSGGGLLLGENDDYTVAVSSLQDSLDATLRFGSLNAGSYLLTLVANPNGAVSSSLADGFLLGNGAGSAFSTGPNYVVSISEVGNGISLVPEPAAWLLMAMGLSAGLLRRRGLAHRGASKASSHATTQEVL